MSTHGLTYPPDLLTSLPALPTPAPTIHPIRLLPAPVFADLHLRHLLAHAPDHILFPFLHGIEGANHAQNLFFQANSGSGPPASQSPALRVPPFRGLVWVVADDDLDDLPPVLAPRPPASPGLDDDLDDDDEDDEDFEEDGPGFAMDIDIACDVADMPGEAETQDAHMHPVHHRAGDPAKPPPLAPTPSPQPHDRRTSTASTTSSLSTDSSVSALSEDTQTDATSALSASCIQEPKPALAVAPPAPADDPPILTSTFRACDLLRKVWSTWDNDQGEQWEFVPPRVPDGISLRNFGIQVPIYATLSDIVVYSPKGRTPAAVALAERFRQAIGRKRRERAERFGSRAKTTSEGAQKVDETIDDNKAVEMKEVVGAEKKMEVNGGEMDVDAPPDDIYGDEKKESGSTAEEDDDGTGLLHYNVFVLDADADEMRRTLPHLMVRVHAAGEGAGLERHARPGPKPNTVDFAQREKEEMRDLTKASEIISVFPPDSGPPVDADLTTTRTFWDPRVGQVFLGNSNDVPLVPDGEGANGLVTSPSTPSPPSSSSSSSCSSPSPPTSIADADPDADLLAPASPFNSRTNSPTDGFGYDLCIECHDLAPFPSPAHLRAAEDHLARLDALWADRCARRTPPYAQLPPRPPPNATAVIHLPFPSSPPASAATMAALLPVVKFLEKCLQPPPSSPPPSPRSASRRWSSVSSLMPSFPPFPLTLPLAPAPSSPPSSSSPSSSYLTRTRSSTTPTPAPPPARTRPLKVLLYSSDGYTESSVPALCLLMAVRALGLPEAYLELQVVKKRSFFVYQSDIGVLRRVEGRLVGEREGGGRRAGGGGWGALGFGAEGYGYQQVSKRPGMMQFGGGEYVGGGRPAAKSVSFAQSPVVPEVSGQQQMLPQPAMVVPSQGAGAVRSRPRASTSPWLPSLFGDHQSWFNDPRFDGSFPSRVLPFLYLGNLAHASNAYMLHALGITHVVSVGECALVPPAHLSGPGVSFAAGGGGCAARGGGGPQFIAGKGPGGQGSLWIEEREGRIKVLDIKGVCDDGIDTLAPQLEPICEWIDRARAEGGQVLVHCRVGVSRSATVTIAYVMKHLGLPLVDAYLIVRSRRLSVLIQPNMRLLYNLCGWEVRLARERAGGDEGRLKEELGRALTWPYLAKEVHALNEKYLH